MSGVVIPRRNITVNALPFSSDRLRLKLTGVSAPPSARTLNAYLYVLLAQDNDWYGARYDGFKEAGVYRIVFYADDNQGTHARPVSVNVTFGTNQIYLPMVTR